MVHIGFSRLASIAVLAVFLSLAGCGKKGPDGPQALKDGRAAIEKGDFKAAILHLKNAVVAQPESGEARYFLARAHLGNNELALAQKEYEKAFDLNYNREAIAPGLAELLLETQEFKVLQTRFGDYRIADKVQQSQLLSYLGRSRMGTNDPKGARRDFEQALALNPGQIIAKAGLARVQASEGDMDGALTAANSILSTSPNDFLALVLKSDILSLRGDYVGSIDAMERAVKAKPNDHTGRANLIALYSRVNRSSDAAMQLEELKKRAGNGGPVAYLEALELSRKGNLPAAREAITLALRNSPESVPYVMAAANIEGSLGNTEAAEKHLQFVLARIPDKAMARVLLARNYIRAGRSAQATEILEPILKAGTKDAEVFSLAAEAAALSGDYSKSTGLYEQALKLAPDKSGIRSKLGLAKLSSGNIDSGMADIEGAAQGTDQKGSADGVLLLSLLSQRNFNAALKAADALEKKQPNNPLTYNLKSAAQIGKGDLAGARASLEKGLSLVPDSISLIKNIVKLDLAENKFPLAQKRYEDYLKRFPESAQAMAGLAEVKGRAGAPRPEVVGLFEQAAKVSPLTIEVPLAHTAYLLQQGDTAGGLAVMKTAVQKNQEEPLLLERLGLLQLEFGQGADAIATYSRLTKLQPTNPIAWTKLATAYAVNKNDAGALQSATKALEFKPEPLEARALMIRLAQNAGKSDEALRMAADLRKAQPKSPLGFQLAGEILNAQKKPAEAVEIYKQGLVAAATPQLAAGLVQSLRAAGQTAQADTTEADLIKRNPKDTSLQGLLGEQALLRADWATATRWYKAVIDQRPNDVIALNNLAWAMHKQGQAQALEFAERANKAAPGNVSIKDTLGVILLARNEVERATKLFQEAQAASPNNPEYKLHLAQALVKQGKKDQAKAELEAAAKLNPTGGLQDEIRSLRQTL